MKVLLKYMVAGSVVLVMGTVFICIVAIRIFSPSSATLTERDALQKATSEVNSGEFDSQA